MDMFDESPSEPCEILTLTEARRILRWGETKAYQHARAGTFPGLLPRIGGRFQVSRRRLMAFIEGQDVEQLGGDAA